MELGKTAFWDYLCAARAGTLIHGLPGPKTLHILESECTGAEKSSPHLGNYKMSLEEVKKDEDQANIHPSGAIYRKMKHPWYTGIADYIRKAFDEKTLVEAEVQPFASSHRGWTWTDFEAVFLRAEAGVGEMSSLG
jgi:hypothetical protein